jgi:hypothetical protein
MGWIDRKILTKNRLIVLGIVIGLVAYMAYMEIVFK